MALYDAIRFLKEEKGLATNPFKQFVASISVGVHQGESLLDLNYEEDSSAGTDMNVVMTERGGFIEIQGTAEKDVFHQEELDKMLALAKQGITQLIEIQKEAVK